MQVETVRQWRLRLIGMKRLIVCSLSLNSGMQLGFCQNFERTTTLSRTKLTCQLHFRTFQHRGDRNQSDFRRFRYANIPLLLPQRSIKSGKRIAQSWASKESNFQSWDSERVWDRTISCSGGGCTQSIAKTPASNDRDLWVRVKSILTQLRKQPREGFRNHDASCRHEQA